MNDETLYDDLSTLNQNSSSSILYRTLNIHYISQKYIIRSSKKILFIYNLSIFYSEDNSSQLIQTESMADTTNNEQDKSELLKNFVHLTPRNIAIIELITSEQRFVHDMKNILKVIYHTRSSNG